MDERKFFTLPEFSGKSGGYVLPDMASIEFWDMRQDENGNVYYRTHGTPREINLWCSADQLTGHLRKLNYLRCRYGG